MIVVRSRSTTRRRTHPSIEAGVKFERLRCARRRHRASPARGNCPGGTKARRLDVLPVIQDREPSWNCANTEVRADRVVQTAVALVHRVVVSMLARCYPNNGSAALHVRIGTTGKLKAPIGDGSSVPVLVAVRAAIPPLKTVCIRCSALLSAVPHCQRLAVPWGRCDQLPLAR